MLGAVRDAALDPGDIEKDAAMTVPIRCETTRTVASAMSRANAARRAASVATSSAEKQSSKT